MTNLAGVDLRRYRFDFDLTFAVLIMHADGTIYRTYGGRDATGPVSHLSPASFEATLGQALRDHAAHRTTARRVNRSRTIEEFAPEARRLRAGKKRDCYHCHQVHELEIEELRERREWKRPLAWKWPDPIQAGLVLDRDDQRRVTAVSGAAAAAGLAAGDELRRFGGRAVYTFGDVQRVLDESAAGAIELAVEWERGGEVRQATVRLPAGWKEPTAEVFAWRPTKWVLEPVPGFGGRPVPRAEGLFRVGYLVTWGPRAYSGRNARKAGIRKGDVVVSVAGRADFSGMDHFHAWFRFTQKVGTTIPVVLSRNGQRRTIQLPVVDR